jgi:hypothetical protein
MKFTFFRRDDNSDEGEQTHRLIFSLKIKQVNSKSNKYLKFDNGKWKYTNKMRRILMSDEMKGQTEMMAGAQLIIRWKIVASLFRIALKVARQVANVPLKQLKCLFFQRPSHQVRHLKFSHRMGRLSKRANTNEN